MADQGKHIRDTQLGTAFGAVSLFSGATEAQRVIMTLWSAHTYTYRLFAATPRIDFAADEPGAGKTVNMQVTTALSQNPLVTGYASQASVYSYLDEHPNTTLGLDEVDKIFGTTGRRTSRDILRAVINDGYTSKGTVMVMRKGKAVLMPVFCPVAMAGLGSLPVDTGQRAIIIHLRVKMPSEVYVPELNEETLSFIGGQVREWVTSKESNAFLREAPKMAEGVDGSPRERLIYAPLAAIARLAGIEDQFVASVQEIQKGIIEAPPTPVHELMLSDLRQAWPADAPDIANAYDIIKWLGARNPGRWGRLTTDRLGQVSLAGMFKDAGIGSRTSNGVRGYRREDVFAGA